MIPKGNSFLTDYGDPVLENGYNIVPIKPGTKRPYPHIEGWQQINATKGVLRKWISEGCGMGGIGINCRTTPAVDIDVTDEEVSLLVVDFIRETIGMAPVRIGKYPKHLLMFKCSAPFRKMMSKKYRDDWLEPQRIEILGDGQQFVALHIHPDTKLPYRWDDDKSPLGIHRDDLPELTEADARKVIAYFEELAEERGWDVIARGTVNSSTTAQEDDDPFAADAPRITISDTDLKDRLMLIPEYDDYDMWFKIGMALYHQFDGDYAGLDMWREWSSSSDKYDERACEKKWKTFDVSDKNRAPVTAKFILSTAREYIEAESEKLVMDLADMFNRANDQKEWKAAIKEAKKAEINSISRAELTEVAKKSFTRITGNKIPVQEVRKAMAYELNSDDVPIWCRDWVYDSSDDKFFNAENKIVVSKQGFDAVHDRKALTKKDILEGKTSPSSGASELALNVYKIPTVHGRMYAPGRDPVFLYAGNMFANTYPENQVPALPEKVSPKDQRNIKRVIAHVAHLLADKREQRLLLSWIAYVVQNPGKRVNWAVLLQGTEGDGKSFFAFLLRAVMGIPNVSMLNASSFKSDFTGWAVGQCVTAVEELRLQGEGRFDILNKIKPFITNNVVEIHFKGKTQVNAENTTNYLLFTNFRDALPINDNDRRYFVLFSRWQNKEALRNFKDENPDYYMNLYGAIAESASALRKWLLDFELCEEFNPMSDAPITEAHGIMVQAAMAPEVRALHEIIRSDRFSDISDELVNVTRLGDEMSGMDIEIPNTSRWHTLLGRDGWSQLDGRVFLKGRLCRFFAKNPEKFTKTGTVTGEVSGMKVQLYLDTRPEEVEDDPFMDDEL